MYLSSLTLFGFKSFIDRLNVEFQPGMTALVGPNGCGKSNILDAIRWVLGEQSAKALRGDRMEDMIFAGNSHRKPVGMAEVSLTLTNVNGRLSVPYEEVTITRRLYRSGESEYLLNHNPCRLKDITRLFLDTGLGREPYALIEQGSIGSVLGSKPADRRALLEEAAGIMSYKVNRNVALGKLEAAEQNLLRVADILQEVERQRNSLYRQAKKAERYQRMTARLKEIQVFLLLNEDRRLGAELNRVAQQEKELTAAHEGCQLRLSTAETSLETGRLQDLDLEKRISAAQERLFTLRSRREREETEMRSREALLHDVRRRREEQQEELEATSERLQRLVHDVEVDAKARELAVEELDQESQRLRELSDASIAVEAELRQCEEGLQQRKRDILALTERLVGHRNLVASLTERDRLLQQERATVDRQLSAARTESETMQRRERELTNRLREVESQIQSLNKERGALSEEVAQLEGRQEALADRRVALREELRGMESRLDSLRELEASLAGLSEGQQFLLKGKAAGVPECQAIEGPFSSAIRVDAAWEKAVEALLGELQQGLLVPTTAAALSLLQHLEEEGPGWATLLPRRTEWHAGNGTLAQLEEALQAVKDSLGPEVAQRIVGPAVHLVKAPEGLQPLLYALLEDAVIVHDLPTALAVLQAIACPTRVATPSGTVLSSRGPIQGGTTTAFSLLSRRRELEELPASIAQMASELRELEEEWESVQHTLGDRRRIARGHEQTLRETEAARHAIERSLAEVHTVASRLASHSHFLDSELARLAEELADLNTTLQKARGDLQEWGHEEDTLKQEAAEHDSRVTLLRTQQQEVQREVAENRIRLTSLQERKEALDRSLERLESDMAREREREAEIHREADEGRSREAKLAQEIAALQESLAASTQQEGQDAEAVQKLQRDRDDLRQTLLAHEEALKALRKDLIGIQQQQAGIATSQAALNTERSLLQKRLQEECPAADTLRERADAEDPSQAPEALGQEGEAIREKIAAMGLINMAALEEYETLSERHRFLTNQAEDLTASVASLRATIVEINRTIKSLFDETLAAVNQHLNHFWQRLFRGGEAELVSSEADNAHEPGVEIRVRIPGKRTTTLSLLSGGEKTLGAIAFLMALWATRPSPFVVLDEVDAALDDHNVERFASLLRELATTSQFILVTHHPRTIETADLLYGITMEEPGISRLISVRLGHEVTQATTATAS